ncbi:hypothetical protein PVAG01_10835 [Phlyctema vagabunda]|uniref:Uncharacterized protein n=1 Tax=Phlyctema vagabunda TaxID=108571 RepID=A0ABR4P3E5_9HELO
MLVDGPPDKSQSVSGSEWGEQAEEDSMDLPTALTNAYEFIELNQTERKKQRKVIENDHKGNVKELEVKIDTLFKARKSRVNKVRKSKLDQLDALLKKRKYIESLIIASMKLLETHTSNLSKELIVVYEGRQEDIRSMGEYEKLVPKQ